MPFFGQGGGAAPGAARNSLANFPPKGTGFAGTKPPVPPVGGYRYGAMPPAGGATTGQDQIGGIATPRRPDVPVQGVPAGLTNVFKSFSNNGTGAGAVTGGGYQGGGGAGDIGGNRQARQLRRQMRPDGMPDAPPSDAMSAAADPTGANRAGMEYRRERRQAARQAGLEDPAMADGPNQQWRADRRQAMRQGLVEQTADGGYTSTQPADPNGQGAQRDGMGWRAERRQAVKDGTYTPPTGADRNGFGYRQDRRQAARRAANMPPAKPGQPPAM